MIQFIKFSVLMFFLFNFVYVSNANAEVITAASCSQSDVQTAINSASDGDIINVPAGECTWTNNVTIPNTKGLYIIGAGINNTVIRDNTPAGFGKGAFYITGALGRPFRISGFTFEQGTADIYGFIEIHGTCTNWKIDNCEFDGVSGYDGIGIYITNITYGVIYDCEFKYLSQGVYISAGNSIWENQSLDLGGSNFVFIEDCEFTFSTDGGIHNATDGHKGGRYVFRYNTITNGCVGHHGTDSGVDLRSVHACEVYNNTITRTSGNQTWAISSRGGTGVYYNNVCTTSGTGDFSYFIVLRYYRSCVGGLCDEWGWGCCDGTYNGGGSLPGDGNQADVRGIHSGASSQTVLTVTPNPNWANDYWVSSNLVNYTDGDSGFVTSNTDSAITVSGGGMNWSDGDSFIVRTGYPCMDQPGRSTNQVLEPIYEWNNTFKGGNDDGDIVVYTTLCDRQVVHLQENRDFYNDTQRPGYTPYPYPHPLTIQDILPPTPPSNLRVVR